ncbi:MAG: PSP1 domain-containing protein [Bacteroidota bacterium]
MNTLDTERKQDESEQSDSQKNSALSNFVEKLLLGNSTEASDGDPFPESCCGVARLIYDLDHLRGTESAGEYVEVQFKAGRRSFYKNPFQLDLHIGDYVIVEAEKGIDIGRVHFTGKLAQLRWAAMYRRAKTIPQQFGEKGSDVASTLVCVEEESGNTQLSSSHPEKKNLVEFAVLRKATAQDLAQHQENAAREREAFELCQRKIPLHGLPMKLVDVEYQFDRNRITFYFTADKRVDFRSLVRDLASVYRTRIELRQISARDEARRIGGIGSCGRPLCCAMWIGGFYHISTQHARLQNLPLNPVKLSGQCGRLKCCLAFELEDMLALNEELETAHGGPAVDSDHDLYNESLEYDA